MIHSSQVDDHGSWKDYAALDFGTFKTLLSSRYVSSFSLDFFTGLEPLLSSDGSTDMGGISRSHKLFGESMLFVPLSSYSPAPDTVFFHLMDEVDMEFRTTFEGLWLYNLQLLIHDVELLRSSLSDFKDTPALTSLALSLPDYSSLASRIRQCVDDLGGVRDDATPELRRIRGVLRSSRNTAYGIAQNYTHGANSSRFIQDDVLTMKNGRYTIACKSSYRSHISNGILQGVSKSGQTFFVEPSDLASVNNSIHQALSDERAEVFRILRDLSDEVYDSYENFVHLWSLYGELLFFLETAHIYSQFEYCYPEFSNTSISLVGVHHPVIYLMSRATSGKSSSSVPISFDLDESCSLAVISGANAGGKSSALKSVGLNHIIAKCGLPLFGKKAVVMDYRTIMADIGDHQSIDMSLSTFSANVVNIKRVLETAQGNDLVLLDELGSSTEPREGAALAVAVLESMLSKGVKCIVTTHYGEVKKLGFAHEGAVSYGTTFDEETLMPTYKLLKGVMGVSNPFTLARRMGLPEEVLERAEHLVDASRTMLEKSVEELNEMRVKVDAQALEVAELERYLNEQREDLKQRENNLTTKLAMKEEDLLSETMALLQQAKRLSKEAVRNSVRGGKVGASTTNKPETKVQNAETLLTAVRGRVKAVDKHKVALKDINVGHTIFLNKYQKEATVIEIEGSKIVLDLGGMRVTFPRKDINNQTAAVVDKNSRGNSRGDTDNNTGRNVPKSKNTQHKQRTHKGVQVVNTVNTYTSLEKVLVGMRVDDGIDELDRFLDEAVLSNHDKIYVIHGRGSGDLRRAVHQFLKSDRRVKTFRLADHEQGEQGFDAVTVVFL